MTIEPPLEASRFPSHSIPATEQTHVNIYYSTPGNARSDALRWHTEEYRSWRSEAEEKAGQQQWQPCFHTTGDSMEEGLGESTASLRTLQEMCIIGIGQTGWAEKNEDVSTKRYSSDPSNSFPSLNSLSIIRTVWQTDVLWLRLRLWLHSHFLMTFSWWRRSHTLA